MTSKEFYEKELERLQRILPETDPREDGYSKVLFAMRELDILANRESLEEISKAVEAEAETEEKTEAPQAEADLPWTEDSPYPEPKQEERSEELTYESVREALNQARGRGVLLQPIIMKFVPEGSPAKFSSIPAESYPALMEELKDA